MKTIDDYLTTPKTINDYLNEVDEILKKYYLFEKFHCKIKDNSMLRVIELSSKRRIFIKEEDCDKYISEFNKSAEFATEQFNRMNERNFFIP